MRYQYTPGAHRAILAGCEWSGRKDSDELEGPALLLGLLSETECRAAIVLARHGIDAPAVRQRWPELTPREVAPGTALPKASLDAALEAPPVPLSTDVELSLQTVDHRLDDCQRPLELATEHLLLGLAGAHHEVADWLRGRGLDPDALQGEIEAWYGCDRGLPLDIPSEAPAAEVGPCEGCDSASCVDAPQEQPSASLTLATSLVSVSEQNPTSEGTHTLRVLDAAANRAGEGLRVVEDYVRFVLDDRHLTGLCKQLRHDLAAVLGKTSHDHRMAARETTADVGTHLTTDSEQHRASLAGVLTANLVRLQQSLRSLEEFGKRLDARLAGEFEQLRYRSYTLQRAIEITRSSRQRLAGARLYVLVDGRSSVDEFQRLAESLVQAGVDVLQLRDKRLDDRSLLERARRLRQATAGTPTLFIMNDRPDLAALARADGVHVGQEELSVKDARSIVGPEALIGVSTHTIEQARQAVLDGANYLGVGPTFPSDTKQFDHFPGVELLQSVAAEIRLPSFAIGGITPENLPLVLATGITRIAVSQSITASADPPAAARALRALL